MNDGQIDHTSDQELNSIDKKNHALVEGAVLADISVVLLLARVYLPVPGLRTMWRLLAAAPLVILAKRRGYRVTIIAGLVSYVLLASLTGPVLALPALDTAFAAILIAVAMQFRWNRWVAIPVTGLVYSVGDIIIPSIIFAKVLGISLASIAVDMATSIRGATHVAADSLAWLNQIENRVGLSFANLNSSEVSRAGVHASTYFNTHWMPLLVGVAILVGVVNMCGYQIATETVLRQIQRSVSDAAVD